jgi:hypothetical protein
MKKRCYMCKKPFDNLDSFGLCPKCADRLSEKTPVPPMGDKPFVSKAEWPDGSISEDRHDSMEAAVHVCRMLQRDGLGGDGHIFPVKAVASGPGVEDIVLTIKVRPDSVSPTSMEDAT